MPNTLSFIGNNGLTFKNAMVATPVCCPSRTETISGRYFQNVRYPKSEATCASVAARWNSLNNTQSLFQIFHSNGYVTAMFGKMTNDQDKYWCVDNPQTNGFDRINSPCKMNYYATHYFDKYLNGTSILHNYTMSPSNYLTSIEGNETIKFLNEMLNNPQYKNKPFLMWVAPHAPHDPVTPASWYSNHFNSTNDIAPRTPNFNLHVYDHHDYMSTNPKLTADAINFIDQDWKNRLRSLLSVDDIVSAISDFFMQTVETQKILNNTYIIFNSDHGYHLGQWRLGSTKMHPYDTDLRVPMLIRGPGINAGDINVNDIVVNVDLVPTFLDLAQIEYNHNSYDGRSWVGSIIKSDVLNQKQNVSKWREIIIAQYMSTGNGHKDFSMASTWWKSNTWNGQVINAPCCNEQGQAWMLDDDTTNNWRALRIINESVDWMYCEFISGSNWTQQALENPYFYEFYDLTDDQYQINNLYSSLSKVTQYELHQMLMNYGSCEGTNCW